jgi:uncharacterized membrane protein YeaQ/YmgE (transglycosylase-associated protein family)
VQHPALCRVRALRAGYRGVGYGNHRVDHRGAHHRPAGEVRRPGAKDNTPLWLTLLCGIGGVLIGYYVSGALGVAATPGIDWMRWIISIIVAAVLVVAASTLTGRNNRAVR